MGGHCFLDRCNHLRQSDKEEVSVRGALVPVRAGCCVRTRTGPLSGNAVRGSPCGVSEGLNNIEALPRGKRC